MYKKKKTTALRVCKVKVKAVLYKVNYFIYKIHFHSNLSIIQISSDKILPQTRIDTSLNSYKEV